MYRISYLPKDAMPDEIKVYVVQYLPDIQDTVRIAFGYDGADKVVIVKED